LQKQAGVMLSRFSDVGTDGFVVAVSLALVVNSLFTAGRRAATDRESMNRIGTMSKDTADDGRMMLRAKQLLALLGVTLVAACGSSPTTEGPSSIPAQTENAGDVVGQESLPDVDPLVTDAASSSRLITYSSHYAVDDSLHHVTTSVYVPKEPPPPDGFPIAALDRQVGGTGRGCGPASDADWSATITALLRSGYVVTVPDYQGFGRPSDHEANFHPFLDSATAAHRGAADIGVVGGSGYRAGRPSRLGRKRTRGQLRLGSQSQGHR
jgi:hypothetical protein